MQEIEIPLFLGSYGNVDEIGLGAYSAILQDAYVDEQNNVRKRPGLESIVDLGTDAGCDGLYWWYKQSIAIHISAQTITKITAAAGTAADITGSAAPEDGVKAYFADYGSVLYAANGGKIISIPTSGDATFLTDGDAPTTVSHIAFLNDKLIALDTSTTETFEWSEAGTPTSWINTFASAQRIPDDLKALAVGNDRLWLWGTHSLEIWVDDGATPFVPEYNGHWPQGGIIGPNAFVYGIDTFYWINQNRQLVRLNGSQIEMLPPGNPQSFTQRIQGLSKVSDADLEYVSFGGRHLIVCHLPTADITLVYDIIAHRWFEWGDWGGNSYTRWTGQRMAFSEAWDMILTGGKDTGRVYKLNPDYYYDGGDTNFYIDENDNFYVDESGNYYIDTGTSRTIRTVLRTGEITHQNLGRRKLSYKYVLHVRRTSNTSSPPTVVGMRWRDDGNTTSGTDSDGWSSMRYGSVITAGQTSYRIEWRRNGGYYSRQIEIIFEDTASFLAKPSLIETLEISET